MIYLFLLFALALRFIIARSFYGTYDVETAYIIADLLKKGSLIYDATSRGNMPPTYFYIVSLTSFLADKTSLPLSFWIKVPFFLADLGIGALIYRITKSLGKTEKVSLFFAALYLFNPLPLLVFSFQGQIDSLFMLLVLVGYLFISNKNTMTKNKIYLSGLALGMAATVKLVPLALVPVFLWHILKSPKVKNESLGNKFLVLGTFLLLAILPLLAEFFPYRSVLSGIVDHVVHYKTAWGIWGISQLLHLVNDLLLVNSAFLSSIISISQAQALSIVVVFVVSYVAIVRTKMPLMRSIVFVFLTEMAISAFLATQYLVWFVPFFILDMVINKTRSVYSLMAYSLLTFVGCVALFKFWVDPNFYLPWAQLWGISDLNSFLLIYTRWLWFPLGLLVLRGFSDLLEKMIK